MKTFCSFNLLPNQRYQRRKMKTKRKKNPNLMKKKMRRTAVHHHHQPLNHLSNKKKVNTQHEMQGKRTKHNGCDR